MKKEKFKNLLGLASALLTASTLFFSCTTDDQLYGENEVLYSYTQEEIQAIMELQAEYNVEFTFKTSSNTPLPSLKSMEELCQIASIIQNATRLVEQGDGYAKFSSKSMRAGGVVSEGEKYTGSYKNSFYTKVGWFEFEVIWEEASGTLGKVECHVTEPPTSDYRFEIDARPVVKGNSTIELDIIIFVYSLSTGKELTRYEKNYSIKM